MAVDRVAHVVVPIPSKESAAAKSRRLLLEGRLRVRLCHRGRAWIEVRGDSGTVHTVRYVKGRWSCSCEATPGTACSHLRACWLILARNPNDPLPGDPARRERP